MLMSRYQLISTLNPRFDFILIKHVVQTNHSPLVTNFLKTFKQLVTNPLRRTVWRNPLWMRRFNALQFYHQAVVHRIADTWLVKRVIFVAVLIEQFFNFFKPASRHLLPPFYTADKYTLLTRQTTAPS